MAIKLRKGMSITFLKRIVASGPKLTITVPKDIVNAYGLKPGIYVEVTLKVRRIP